MFQAGQLLARAADLELPPERVHQLRPALLRVLLGVVALPPLLRKLGEGLPQHEQEADGVHRLRTALQVPKQSLGRHRQLVGSLLGHGHAGGPTLGVGLEGSAQLRDAVQALQGTREQLAGESSTVLQGTCGWFGTGADGGYGLLGGARGLAQALQGTRCDFSRGCDGSLDAA